MKKFNFLIILIITLISGCASELRIFNVELETASEVEPYDQVSHLNKNDDIRIFLSFSGGGTRAAAFSYGVLEALRDTKIKSNNKKISLLSEVDIISSVSGGSFTSAYYGLYGEKIFEDYESVFLKQDVQKSLISRLFNPFNWFKFTLSGFDRTELAIDYYDTFIFKQEYFNYLCSDLAQFQVARAVTASSAVPVAFAPIVVKNYKECDDVKQIEKLTSQKTSDNFRAIKIKESMKRYLDKDNVQYVHLVDGGITDNLGLRVLYDTVNVIGSASDLVKKTSSAPPRYLVLILANAAVSSEKKMDKRAVEPSLSEQIEAISSAQIDRYSAESIQLLKDSLKIWAAQLSNSVDYEVKPFFIEVDFTGIQDKQKSTWANKVSTSLALPSEQVDGLRNAARHLLKQSPEFQRLLSEISN